MISLLLAVICSVLIGNLLVIFTRSKDSDLLYIFLGNYIIAALFSLVTAMPRGISFSGFDLWFGALTGLLFLLNFVAYQKNIAVNGLSLSVGTMRVAIIIPTLMAVIWFAERLGVFNLVGIIVIMSAFAVVTDVKLLRKIFWLVFLFLVSGFTESTLKIYSEMGNTNQGPFLMVIFASAGIFTLLWIIIRQRNLNLKSIYKGFALGVPNQLSSFFFLQGLKMVTAPVAYPFYASGVVIGSILCDVLIWRRYFTLKQRIALGLLVAGVILINVHR